MEGHGGACLRLINAVKDIVRSARAGVVTMGAPAVRELARLAAAAHGEARELADAAAALGRGELLEVAEHHLPSRRPAADGAVARRGPHAVGVAAVQNALARRRPHAERMESDQHAVGEGGRRRGRAREGAATRIAPRPQAPAGAASPGRLRREQGPRDREGHASRVAGRATREVAVVKEVVSKVAHTGYQVVMIAPASGRGRRTEGEPWRRRR